MRKCFAAIIVAMGSAVSAQPTPQPPTDLTLRPAAAPVPALKYRFAADPTELVGGNAAIFYHRAILMLQHAQYDGRSRREIEQAVIPWLSCPISEIPIAEARDHVRPIESALHEVELGALRRDCDWQFEDRSEGIALLIPEIQESRSLVRFIALRVRLAVLDGRTDDAVHWLQVGMALARHVATGPTFIQNLVGQAIMGQLARPLQDLIEAPGTPSLYWALATMPRPWIDLGSALAWERIILEREVPAIRDADGPTWSLERARQVGDEILRKLAELGDNRALALVGEGTAAAPTVNQLVPRLGLAAIVARAYPAARSRLIADGRAEADVDAMPTLQVVMIDGYRQVRQARDDSTRWFGVPYWQSHGATETALSKLFEEKTSNPVIQLYAQLAPAVEQIRLAHVRGERQFAAFQAIEAIRLHAAAHGGELPTNLDAITEAPVPLDPATGKPFGYALQGSSAALSAPMIPGAPTIPGVFSIQATLKPAR